MKKIFYTILACTAIYTGCSKVSLMKDNGTGGLSLSLACTGNDYSDKNIYVKSEDPIVDINEFEITINSASGSYTKTFLYKDAPSMLELAADSYTITAASPAISGGKAAWDAPEYACSKEVEIAVGKISNIDLNCTLSNMKVSINCSDKFMNELSDFVITVSQDNSSLTWERQEVIAARSGYFPVAPLRVFVRGTRAIDNSTATVTFNINDVAPKDHHVINIDATTTGDAQFSLSIDTSTNDKDVKITVPGFDETPVPDPDPEQPENPGQAEAPSIVWETNPDFSTMDIVDGMDVNLVVKAPGKIKSFIVTVSDNFASLVDDMGAENGVMDLINNSELIGNLGELLPTGDALRGKTEVPFSLSSLVPMIALVGNKGEDYTFTLDVEDELGQTLSKVCTFHNPAAAE